MRQPLQCATWHCGHVAKVLSISDDRTFGSTQHLQCARRLGTTSTSFFLLARGLRRRGSPPSGRKAPVECFPPDPVPHNEAGSVLWNLVRTRQLHRGTMPSPSRSNIGIRSRFCLCHRSNCPPRNHHHAVFIALKAFTFDAKRRPWPCDFYSSKTVAHQSTQTTPHTLHP